MAYSVQSDVQSACGGAKKLVELADWDNDGVADAAEIATAVTKADALIDSFASKRFHVPFSPVPSIITQMSASLAKLILARNRRQLTQDEADEWTSIAGTETGKEGWLYRLATGVVTPGGDPLPLAHSTMAVDSVDTSLPCDRDLARDKTAGYW